MLSLAAFRVKYPEFQTAGDSLVQLFLNDAAVRIDAEVWGDHADMGHGLLAAHLLAIAPNGQFARLETAKGETTYGTEHHKLEIQVACGIRIF